MAVNLLSLLQNEFSGDVVSKVASLLGEPPAKTQSAVASAIPAVIGALTQRASTPQGAGDLFGMLQKGGFDGNMFGSLASVLGKSNGATDLMKLGGPLLASLFGSRQTGLINWLASAAGISQQSSTSLMSLVAPFALNFIGKQAASSGGFNLSSLTSLLGGQASYLGNAPAGLASALGLGSFSELGGAAARRVEQTATQAASTGMGWLKWLLPLLAILALFAIVRSCRTTAPDVTANLPSATDVKDAATAAKDAAATAATEAGHAAAAAWAKLGAFVKRSLPDGIELDIPENGIEWNLLAFIQDAARPVDDKTWFSFDRLEFETGSAVLKPSSREQLSNIAAILKAYPNVDVKIGGYTDNTGDKAANMALSADRAVNTMKELVSLGVAATRMSAEGYGDQFPVASNDTEEGRQRNRRIDIRVTKK